MKSLTEIRKSTSIFSSSYFSFCSGRSDCRGQGASNHNKALLIKEISPFVFLETERGSAGPRLLSILNITPPVLFHSPIFCKCCRELMSSQQRGSTYLCPAARDLLVALRSRSARSGTWGGRSSVGTRPRLGCCAWV